MRPSLLSSRRTFLKTAVGGSLAVAALPLARSAHAAGSDVLRVGLVGCGGRGCGAAVNALSADPHAQLVALADIFPERMAPALQALRQAKGAQVAVDADHQFSGFDAYRQLIECVDVVLLATPSHFHPIHLKAAVDAGRHVFVEKPHGVDPAQVRMVQAACDDARQKKLCVVSGLCWRYHKGVRETMDRVLDGAIGDVVSVQETYMTGFSWTRPREPGDTEMKYQLRNWYNFTWLSGDLPGLTLIHSLDKGSWALGDVPPQRVWGLGGRQVRIGREYGDVFDHHALVYEYANGARMFAYVRQTTNCHNSVEDHILGTKGRCDLLRQRITGETNWHYQEKSPSMYDEEHRALFQAIRKGEPVNNGNYMVTSTMLAVIGRLASYTGQAITWDEAMNGKLDLSPSAYAWDALPPTLPDAQGNYPIPTPGITRFGLHDGA
jgi:predicted dehydrogenase